MLSFCDAHAADRRRRYHAEERSTASHPIVPFIEGDGTGPDIWRASVRVFDAAVTRAFGGSRKIAWFEVPAGEKAKDTVGEWLPNDTLEAVRAHKVAIKGPLTTPVGGGIEASTSL